MHAAAMVKTDADAPTDARCCIGVTSDIKSYSYIIISLPVACTRRASLAKKGRAIPASLYVTANVNSLREGTRSPAIYRGVKAKVPIIDAFKGP